MSRPKTAIVAGVLLLVTALALCVLPGGAVVASDPGLDPGRIPPIWDRASYVEPGAYKPGEVIVQFEHGTQAVAMNAAVEAFSATDAADPAAGAAPGAPAGGAAVTLERMHVARSAGSLTYAVYSSTLLSVEEMVERFQTLPGVVAVSPNYVRVVDTVPNDPYYPALWGMENTGQVAGVVDADIDASAAWDITTGSSDVVVAVIDTGVDYTHPDLAANMWHNPGEVAGDGIDNDGNGYVDDIYGIDAFAEDSDPMDWVGHGTHVAGTIAGVGDNGIGVAGVSWQTKIMAFRWIALHTAFLEDSLECINYVIDMKLTHGVNVVAINASYGGITYSAVERNAVQAAGNAGIVFVAAAGNDSMDNDANPHYPASYPCSNIVAVGASDTYDAPASFSDWGATSVDLFAPGVAIRSTYPGPSDVPFYYAGPGDPFYDDMEGGVGGWTSTGTWAITSEGMHTHGQCWSDSPYANYANNANTRIVSPTIDLTGVASLGAVLSFGYEIDLEDGYDYLCVDLSSNGGSTWTNLDTLTGWDYGQYSAELPAGYLNSTFRVRFRLVTNATNVNDGVFLDDIGVVPVGYQVFQGTSMATPHVAGTIALCAVLAPGDTVAERIAHVLDTVDHPAALAGLSVTGGRLNAAAAAGDALGPPVVTGLDPTSGPAAGGTVVGITGTDFVGLPTTGAVTFGGTAATYTVDSDTHITATAPSHAGGVAQVTVTGPGGSSPYRAAANYTYFITYLSIKGVDRYDTAVRISKAMFPGPLPAGAGVVLAPGDVFQPALCGAPLAAAYGGPVLLNSTTILFSTVRTELQRLDPDYVFCIGLSAAVAGKVKEALPAATVMSIGTAGGNVYEMSRKVANALKSRVGDLSAVPAIITIGTKFPDALGVSPLACARLWPIILTDKADASPLHAQAAATLTDLGILRVIKVGTYATLPLGVSTAANLSGVAPPDQSHLARYYTNANVANYARTVGLSFAHTAMATGDKFPDALAAGPYLALDDGILLLSPLYGPVPQVIKDVLTTRRNAVRKFTFIACIEPVIGTVKGILP
jgi:subtilisin family serine protease